MKFTSEELAGLAVAAIFVQNLVMVSMLGSRVFFKVLRSPAQSMKFGALVTISTTLASALAWVLNRFLLSRAGLHFLSPFAFVLALLLIEAAAEGALRLRAGLREKIGTLLPASVFNCAVLGLVLINVQENAKSFPTMLLYGFFAGAGFILSLLIAASAMERVSYSSPPAAFKGLPIALVTASLISLAFMGFAGIQL